MKAHELLTSAEMWYQESPAKDAHGNKLQVNDPQAIKWCVLGAIQKLHPPSQRSEVMDLTCAFCLRRRNKPADGDR